jgi:hypothetical protein
VAETGQPYVFTGDDPLNETDPLGSLVDQGPGEPIAGISAASAAEADVIESKNLADAIISNSGAYHAQNQPPSIARIISSALAATNNGLNDGFHDVENWANDLPGATAVNNAGFAASNFISRVGHDIGCYVTGEYPGSFGKSAISNILIDSGGLALRIAGGLREAAIDSVKDDGPTGVLVSGYIIYGSVGSGLVGSGLVSLGKTC